MGRMAQPLSYVPCEAWADVADWCCPDIVLPPVVDPCPPGQPPPTIVSPWTQAQLIDMASAMLYGATGWLFPGLCSQTWEYDAQCHCPKRDCRGCNQRECLPVPVTHYPLAEITSIVEVDENGVQTTLDLNAAGVVITDYGHICRSDGLAWEACRTLVTGLFGRTPPFEGQIAALKLACALAYVCAPEACNGANVTGFTAAGRDYSLQDVRQLLADGTIPIPEVQLFLAVYGEQGKRPYIGRVWSPDMQRRHPRRITWP